MVAQVDANIRDTYFALWTITPEGHRDPQRLRQTIDAASAMIRQAGAECHLFVTIGGPYDLIGWARGIDDERVIEMVHAINGFGTLTTTFIKAIEFSQRQHDAHRDRINALRNIIP